MISDALFGSVFLSGSDALDLSRLKLACGEQACISLPATHALSGTKGRMMISALPTAKETPLPLPKKYAAILELCPVLIR
jgi:hypothetical protein